MNIADKVLQLKQDFDEVYEAGKQEIWKGITNNGTRVNYANGFQYNDLAHFYPYTNLQPTNAGYMFAQTRDNDQVDLVARFEECGSTLDFSQSTNMARTFYVSGVTRLGVIDCKSATALDYLFALSSYLHTIELMKVDAENTYNNSFNGTSGLVEIRFEGVIGNNIDLSSCKDLSHDSMINDDKTGVINVLATLENGVTRTLTISSETYNELTEEERAVATDEKGWSLVS